MRPGKTHDDLFTEEAGYIVGKSFMFLSKFATWIWENCSIPDARAPARRDQVRRARRGHPGFVWFCLSGGVVKNVCQLPGNWYKIDR